MTPFIRAVIGVLALWTLAAFISLALATPAVAQFRCSPKTMLTPLACGTPYREISTAEGKCELWWSALPATASAPSGSWVVDRRCCLTKYCNINPDVQGMVKRIANHASGVLQGMNDELVRLRVVPGTDQEKYEYTLLSWKACEDARVNIPLMIEPAASRPNPPANWCGTMPVAPALAEQWQTVGGRIYTTTARNERLAAMTARTAVAGLKCRPDLNLVIAATRTYAAIDGFNPAEVAQCVKVQP